METVPRSLLLVLLALLPLAALSLGDEWLNHGGGLENWRYARGERRISSATAKNLELRWEFVAGGDISATPAIYKGMLYFPSFNGGLYAVKQSSGSLLWSKNLTQLTGFSPYPLVGSNVVCRSTPVVYGDVLLLGIIGPAAILAFDRLTGSLLWTTLLDGHPFAVVTQGGTAYKGFYYVGVSSIEELAAADPSYVCCNFIGSMNKVDIGTGKVVWKKLMLPDNGGSTGLYAGAAVWGSSPAIDRRRQLVYIATGNAYRAPPDITACAERLENSTTREVPDPCVEPENLSNAVVALELGSGNVRWGRHLGGYDAWTVACVVVEDSPNCPPGPAEDYDFGQSPMLITIPRPRDYNHSKSAGWIDVAVAAQKSGIVWTLDRDSGEVVGHGTVCLLPVGLCFRAEASSRIHSWWAHVARFQVAGPGGRSGGSMWGSATDGKSVYVNIANSEAKNFTLLPSSSVITGGGWVGLNAFTGDILWTTAAPNNTGALGPLTLANGVVLASSDNRDGDVYALDAKSGHILWHSAAPVGTVRGGFSVSDGCGFVGGGYAVTGGAPGTSLYAFCIN